MRDDEYDAFISYRREYDSQAARLVFDELTDRGFRVFLDVEGLPTGRFDEALLRRIGDTLNFVIILSAQSLDRCDDEGDWFCREIAHAVRTDRNIVPVLMPGFEFPPASELPEEIRALPAYTGIRYSHEFFGATVQKIVGCLQWPGTFRWFLRRLLHRLTSWPLARGLLTRAALMALAALTLVVAGVWAYRYLRPAQARPKTEGTPETLTVLKGWDTSPAFAPDGKEVVYVSDNGEGSTDLYAKSRDNDSPPRALTRTAAAEYSPAWSRDGKYVAYLREPSDPQDKWGFYKVTKYGGEEVKIADAFHDRRFGSRHEERSISWAKDDKHLAVMDRRSAAEPFRIYFIPLERRGERVQLTNPKGLPGDANPALSPDGQTLAFTRAESSGASNIYLQRLEGDRPTDDPAIPVTRHNIWVADLAWAPDGKHLIFSANDGGLFRLWTLPAAEHSSDVKPQSLGDLGANLFSPTVSSGEYSEKYLAYSNVRSWDVDIYSYRLGRPSGEGADAGEPFQASPEWDLSPHFSLKSDKVSFASGRFDSREIYVCELKIDHCLHPIRVTKFRGPDTGSPRISPDGKQVVFDTEVRENREIFVVNAERDNNPRPLVVRERPYERPNWSDVRPSWSADGRWVYFGSNRTGRWEVWKVSAEGGTPKQFTKGGGREAFESPDGVVYYAKEVDDHWELWKVAAGSGEETLVLGHVRQGFWAVTRKGIYYLEPKGSVPLAVKLYRFDKKEEATGVELVRNPGNASAPGLAVSPDDTLLLLQREVDREGNIMFVKLADR